MSNIDLDMLMFVEQGIQERLSKCMKRRHKSKANNHTDILGVTKNPIYAVYPDYIVSNFRPSWY